MLRKIIIILAWGLAGLVVVLGTTLLVAYGTGYSYDFKMHRLVQNGLILLESAPSGAKVSVNFKDTRQKTPYRKTFEQGTYNFGLTRDGYRPWNKDITLVATEVSLAQYVLLFEEKLKIDDIVSYPAVSLFTPSEDRRQMAYVVTGGSEHGVWALNTSSSNRTKIYSPQAATADRPAESVQELAWSEDGSHLLIKLAVGDKIQWVVVSDNGREPVVNVTQKFGFDFPSLKFNPQNWRELYWLSEQGLRRLNITDNNISGVLVSDVVDFGFADDRIIYVDNSKPQLTLWALERSGRKVELDSKLPVSTHYQITSSRYRGVPKLAVLPRATGNALIYHDPFGANFGPDLALSGVGFIQFDTDGQFLAGFSESNIVTYGVEKGKLWRHTTAEGGYKSISWLDSHHFIYNQGGKLVVTEFDGGNATPLTPSSPLPSYSSADGKHIFTFLQSSSGSYQLKSIRIRL